MKSRPVGAPFDTIIRRMLIPHQESYLESTVGSQVIIRRRFPIRVAQRLLIATHRSVDLCFFRLTGSCLPAEKSPAGQFLGLDTLAVFVDIAVDTPGIFADGSGWFASTRNLEATCLDLCIACRGHRSTRHVRVTAKTPRHLGILPEPEASRKKRETSSRVPALEVCRVTLAGGFNPRLDRAVWPAALTDIDLGGYFRRPVDKVVWPESLQKLKFGQYYNRPIDGTVFPRGLRELALGYYFDQPIGRVA